MRMVWFLCFVWCCLILHRLHKTANFRPDWLENIVFQTTSIPNFRMSCVLMCAWCRSVSDFCSPALPATRAIHLCFDPAFIIRLHKFNHSFPYRFIWRNETACSRVSLTGRFHFWFKTVYVYGVCVCECDPLSVPYPPHPPPPPSISIVHIWDLYIFSLVQNKNQIQNSFSNSETCLISIRLHATLIHRISIHQLVYVQFSLPGR